MKAARELAIAIVSNRDKATKEQRTALKALLESTTEQAKRILAG